MIDSSPNNTSAQFSFSEFPRIFGIVYALKSDTLSKKKYLS